MKKRLDSRRANSFAFLVLAVLMMGLVGTTHAFYTSSHQLDNMLITKGSEVFLSEYFSPEDKWMAGETKHKEVWFGNKSELDQVIRFKATTEWFDENGDPWAYTGTYSPEAVVLNWTSEITGGTPAWTKIGDYYYYNQVLAKQSGATPTKTPVVLSSVTFSPALGNNAAFGDDFSNKVCTVTIEMEALEVNKEHTKDAWSMTFTQSGSALTWSTA